MRRNNIERTQNDKVILFADSRRFISFLVGKKKDIRNSNCELYNNSTILTKTTQHSHRQADRGQGSHSSSAVLAIVFCSECLRL